jgi:uncharacterized membrane protein (UPF0136 family)
MARSSVALLVVTLGAALIVAGCWILAGQAWGLIAGGVSLIVIGLTVVDVEPRSRSRVNDKPST